jgi:hypothetical protein
MPEIIMYVDVDCIERANSGVVQILKNVYFEPEPMRSPLRKPNCSRKWGRNIPITSHS